MRAEYGGYIEFETHCGTLLHDGDVALNCGRNALAYLFESKAVSKLYLPVFLCSSVPNLCMKLDIPYETYPIDEDFLPLFEGELSDGEYLYVVNYYGQVGNDVLATLRDRHGTVIVDNAEAYFQDPLDGVDTIYNCRKYFGVADGAFLHTDARIGRALPVDESFDRMRFLMGRFERTANEFYAEYSANNAIFTSEPLKRMSKLTENLLRGIDYERVAARRKTNFEVLDDRLRDVNELALSIPYGSFMYPLLVENGSCIRKELQAKKIYIPCLWPNVVNDCELDSVEHRYAADILPIPVDQRYDEKDMEYLVEVLLKCID